jgi:hypothetical protein
LELVLCLKKRYTKELIPYLVLLTGVSFLLKKALHYGIDLLLKEALYYGTICCVRRLHTMELVPCVNRVCSVELFLCSRQLCSMELVSCIWRPRFHCVPFHIKCVVDNIALGQVFLKLLVFFLITVILLILYTSVAFIYHHCYIIVAYGSIIKCSTSLCHSVLFPYVITLFSLCLQLQTCCIN